MEGGATSERKGRQRRVGAALAALTVATGMATIGASRAGATGTLVPPRYLATLSGPSIAAMYPSGVEWDAAMSRIVVADTGNDQIEFYDLSTGRRTGAFGSFGTAGGQFDSPRDVAIDPASNIYVADAGNSRIQKFGPAGNLLWTAGSGVLNTPIGISWDSAVGGGAVLVADTANNLIREYSPSGTLLWTSPSGTTLGFTNPRDATRGPDGRVWLSAYDQNQIKAFSVSPTGAWAATPSVVLGDGVPAGHGVGQLNFPYNAAFSRDGRTVFVADIGNDRIARWDISTATNPVWLAPMGKRCVEPCPNPPASFGEFAFLRRVAVATNGKIIGADFWGNALQVFDPTTGAAVLEIEGFHAPAPGFAQAFGVTVGADGTTYGVDRLNQRVERFSPTGVYQNSGGVRGIGAGAFSWPEDAAVAPDGSVWVADTRGSRLEHWPANLSNSPPVPSYGKKGSAVGQFNTIEGLAVDSAGVVWVADTVNNRIQSFDPRSGAFTVYGKRGTGPCQFSNPQAIAISGGTMYVADTLNNRIQALALSGGACQYLGSATGLSGPQGVAAAPDGTVWVANSRASGVVHLSASLSDLGDGFGSLGTSNLQFNDPHSLAVHGTVLYVADTFNSRIQEFDINGS